jgi:hypothetical protein
MGELCKEEKRRSLVAAQMRPGSRKECEGCGIPRAKDL